MAIKFRKPAIKFIEKADPDTLSRVQEKLNQLLISIEEQSIIPFTEIDIKQMKQASFVEVSEQDLLVMLLREG